MLSQLPEQADPTRLCEQGKTFSGSIALKDFPRLTPLLASVEGEAAFTLEFDRGPERRPRIRGQVRASLALVCQRCLQTMVLPVDTTFQLIPVSGPREAENLPDDYDPLMLEQELLRPQDLVEDELILAIPPAARHPQAECPVDMADFASEPGVPESTSSRKENPFAVLSKLKRDNDE